MSKQIMTLEILKKGLAYIKDLTEKDQGDPLLDSPLSSIGHPLGWESVVTVLILEKGYTFADAAKKLKEAWPDALAAINAARDGKNAKTEICTEQALRRRVLQVAMVRYKQAKAKLKGKLTSEQQVEQTRILEEVKNLYEFLELELPDDGNPAAPADDEKDGKGDVESVIEAGNADKATIPAAEAPTAGQGKSPAPVGKEPKASTADVTADDKKIDTDGISPAEPPVETLSKPDPEGQRGDGMPVRIEPAVVIAEVNIPQEDDDKGKFSYICPECYGQMVINTARQGKNKGHIFYGCAAWRETKCKGTRDMDGQDTTRGH